MRPRLVGVAARGRVGRLEGFDDAADVRAREPVAEAGVVERLAGGEPSVAEELGLGREVVEDEADPARSGLEGGEAEALAVGRGEHDVARAVEGGHALLRDALPPGVLVHDPHLVIGDADGLDDLVDLDAVVRPVALGVDVEHGVVVRAGEDAECEERLRPCLAGWPCVRVGVKHADEELVGVDADDLPARHLARCGGDRLGALEHAGVDGVRDVVRVDAGGRHLLLSEAGHRDRRDRRLAEPLGDRVRDGRGVDRHPGEGAGGVVDARGEHPHVVERHEQRAPVGVPAGPVGVVRADDVVAVRVRASREVRDAVEVGDHALEAVVRGDGDRVAVGCHPREELAALRPVAGSRPEGVGVHEGGEFHRMPFAGGWCRGGGPATAPPASVSDARLVAGIGRAGSCSR